MDALLKEIIRLREWQSECDYDPMYAEFIGDQEDKVAHVFYYEDCDYNELPPSYTLTLIDVLMANDESIFRKRFKDFLLDCAKSDDKTVAFVANDTLAYYKESFDEIE